MKTVFQCENCERIHSMRAFIFFCLACSKEICDSCMDGYAHCKDCAKKLSPEDMKLAWEKEYD